MSEKLSELEKYVCDQCGTEECLSPTKKQFSKEGKNQEGDMIILDFEIYHCCRDNNASSYCDYCERITNVKKQVPSKKEKIREETKVIKQVVDKIKSAPKQAISDLQKRKAAILKQLAEVEEAEKNPD